MFENKIQVVDDFLPKFEQKLLFNYYQEKDLIWKYQKSVSTYSQESNTWAKYGKIQDTFAFTKILNQPGDDEEFVKLEGLFRRITSYTDKKFNVKINEYKRVMRVFYPPNPMFNDNHIMTPHVDQTYSHKNLLYYVSDNDSPTLFLNQMFDENVPTDYSKQTIIKEVYPKQGRAVLFDGHVFHCAGVSKIYPRLTLNINVV